MKISFAPSHQPVAAQSALAAPTDEDRKLPQKGDIFGAYFEGTAGLQIGPGEDDQVQHVENEVDTEEEVNSGEAEIDDALEPELTQTQGQVSELTRTRQASASKFLVGGVASGANDEFPHSGKFETQSDCTGMGRNPGPMVGQVIIPDTASHASDSESDGAVLYAASRRPSVDDASDAPSAQAVTRAEQSNARTLALTSLQFFAARHGDHRVREGQDVLGSGISARHQMPDLAGSQTVVLEGEAQADLSTSTVGVTNLPTDLSDAKTSLTVSGSDPKKQPNISQISSRPDDQSANLQASKPEISASKLHGSLIAGAETLSDSPVVAGGDVSLDLSTISIEADVSIGSGVRSESALALMSQIAPEHGMARADTVRAAASQAVEAWVRHPGKPIAVSLNPEELGRVRMTLSTTDTGITVVITSERPETLDLMRRHIDQLAQEFQRLGYENTAFQFGDDTADNAPLAQESVRQSDIVPIEGEQVNSAAGVRPAPSGLDVRM